MKAKIYTVTAELGSIKSTRTFEQVNDDAAAMQAVNFIMDEAHLHQNGPWALGRIVLANAKGKTIYEMEAKAA
jgi:hypothetical protein